MTPKKKNITHFKAIVIGGSAGSFPVISELLSVIPEDFPIPIFLSMHRLKHIRKGFQEALSIRSIKSVHEPIDKESIQKGKIYLAPANYHMGIELGNSIFLSTDDPANNSRPSIDITLDTASYVYKDKLLAILLSGANKDGAMGMKKVNMRGGTTIVQSPEECLINTMPKAAIEATEIDHVLEIDKITSYLIGNKYLLKE